MTWTHCRSEPREGVVTAAPATAGTIVALPAIRLEEIDGGTFRYFADDSRAAHPNDGRVEPEP